MSEYYRLLGVARDASEADIKKAYRKLAMEFHPDRNRDNGAEEKFKEITEAYQVLCDSQKRALYDRYGKAGVERGGGGFHHVDLSEALNIFMRDFGGFGGFESFFGGGRGQADTRRGQDIRVTVKLTLAEVATGSKRTLKLKTLERCVHCEGAGAAKGTRPISCSTCSGSGEVRRAARSMFGQFVSVEPCPACAGEGEMIATPCEICRGEGRVKSDRTVTVDVPAGVSSNNYLTLRGQGAAGPRNGPNGDLLVLLEIKDDDRFERQADDLIFDLPLSFSQVALGGAFVVPTATGEDRVTIAPGTQTGTIIRLKGKGLPHLGQDGKGDLHVRIHVWTPESLSADQERLFKEMAKIEGAPPKRSSGFWSRVKEALRA